MTDKKIHEGPMFSVTGDESRHYEWPLNPGNHVPSITTTTKNGLPKPQLIKWAAKKSSLLAIASLDLLVRLRDRSRG